MKSSSTTCPPQEYPKDSPNKEKDWCYFDKQGESLGSPVFSDIKSTFPVLDRLRRPVNFLRLRPGNGGVYGLVRMVRVPPHVLFR